MAILSLLFKSVDLQIVNINQGLSICKTPKWDYREIQNNVES